MAGGFVLTRPVPRPRYASAHLLPDTILTLSDCIADFVPGIWALRWASVRDSERAQEAEKFGIRDPCLERLLNWTTKAKENGDFLWPYFFPSLGSVSSFLASIEVRQDDLVLLCFGLHDSLRDRFLTEHQAPPGTGVPGVLDMIRRGEPVPRGGRELGFEILGAEYGGQFHSWLCNGLELVVEEKLGIRPNALGFIKQWSDAVAAADLCDSDEAGAEPVPWFPWLVVRHDLACSSRPVA